MLPSVSIFEIDPFVFDKLYVEHVMWEKTETALCFCEGNQHKKLSVGSSQRINCSKLLPPSSML